MQKRTSIKCEKTSKVLKWLNSIPEVEQGITHTPGDRDAELELGDALKDIHLTCEEECEIQAKFEKYSGHIRTGKETSDSMLFLQGSPCNIHKSHSKHNKTTKRVTFNIFEDDNETQEASNKESNSIIQVKGGNLLDEDRFVLVRNMQDYLKEVAKKRSEKLSLRNKPYIKDELPTHQHVAKDIQGEENDVNGSDTCTINRKLGTDEEPREFDDIICVGRPGTNILFQTDLRKPSLQLGFESVQTVQSRVRLPLWGAKVPHIYRKAQGRPRSGEKPLIKGLVVDAATNQQPSIVRASKNANIREEHALKVRIGGYEKECSQNINTIRLAQRKLNANLTYLKTKMAATSSARAQAEVEHSDLRQELSPDDATGFTAMPLCFPPLVYRNRRILTVSS